MKGKTWGWSERSTQKMGEERRKVTLRIFEKGLKNHNIFIYLKLHKIQISMWQAYVHTCLCACVCAGAGACACAQELVKLHLVD